MIPNRVPSDVPTRSARHGGLLALVVTLAAPACLDGSAGAAHPAEHAAHPAVDVAFAPLVSFLPAQSVADAFCVDGEECHVGDVNGDRRDDLIAFVKADAGDRAAGEVWVALSNGARYDPPFRASNYACVGKQECRVGDVTGDGRADLIALVRDTQTDTGGGDVWIARSNGRSFDNLYFAHDALCVGDQTCRVADVTGDGRADLVVFVKDTQAEPARGDVLVAPSNGVNFDAPYRAHDHICVGSEDCQTGDVNGDGRADVISFVKDSDPEPFRADVWVALSDGKTFQAPYRAHDSLCVGAEACHVADINGDRRSDLLAFTKGAPGDPSNANVVAAESLGREYGPAYRAHQRFCNGDQLCAVGDVDGNGRDDLIAFLKNTQGESVAGDVWAAFSF